MNTKEALTKFFEDTIRDVRADQESKGMRASGRTADSLVYVTDANGGQLSGSDAFYYQIHGRKAGNMPPVSDIRAWIEAKGLNLNAYAVAKNIAKKGTLIAQGKKKGLEFEMIVDKNLTELQKNLGELVGISLVNTLVKEFDGFNSTK